MLTVNILTLLRCEAEKKRKDCGSFTVSTFTLRALRSRLSQLHRTLSLTLLPFISCVSRGAYWDKAFGTLTLTERTHPFHLMPLCRVFFGDNITSLLASLDARNMLPSQMLWIQNCCSTLSPFFLCFSVNTCLHAAQQSTCSIHPHGETLLCHKD